MKSKKIDTWEEVKKRDEEWENSMDGVVYNMKVLGDEVSSEELRVIVAKTLLRLPKKIRKKVLEEVIFILMGGISGTVDQLCFTKFIKDVQDKKEEGNGNVSLSFTQPLILLNFSNMKRREEKDIVAHEIAHFILGHASKINSGGFEREADDLTEKWGFKRSYNEEDYKIMEKKKWKKKR